MEKAMSIPPDYKKTAEEIHYTILLNNCCRELKNCNFYEGVPKYDPALAACFRESGHQLHLKFDFPAAQTEVYAPVRYRSETLQHTYHFPIIGRDTNTDETSTITLFRFTELISNELKNRYPDTDSGDCLSRLQRSIDNMSFYMEHFVRHKTAVNAPFQTFIEAEQNLVTGHSFHPLTKSREGFSEEELVLYSPETNGQFQLHYFLVHDSCVQEASTESKAFSAILREELEGGLAPEHPALELLRNHPEWKPVPVHPWEARYLLTQPEVSDMQLGNLLMYLGPLGPEFTPTSSVRTVYHAESDWMIKLSLHVKITSAERINYLNELQRGYNFSLLLNGPVGQQLRTLHPEIVFMNDPGYISVSYNGNTIDGFNTSFRHNSFKRDNAWANTGLLASICQQEIAGQPARLVSIIEKAIGKSNRTVEDTAIRWFRKYLQMLMPATITMFEKYGFICELHQQNIVIGFDDQYFPARLYLRDNQSYLFRDTMKEELCKNIPGLAEQPDAFTPDKYFHDLLSHFLIISNISGLINTFGANGLVSERKLLEVFYAEIQQLHEATPGSFTAYLLEKRYWCLKGNLITALRNIDGGSAPVSVVYTSFPNLLHKHFFSDQLIFPKPGEVIYSRYFPKEDVTISIRPIDLDSDLEMLHEWFHRPHAVKIWKMDWPIRQLEVYYRTMIAGDAAHSYIGEANGEPSYNFEVYWAVKDMVGDYYEVLPTDYGTHQFIAATDPKKKYASPSTQCMVDYVFAQPQTGRMVGEGSTDSLASIMNKIHVGFRIEKVIEMPHKKANLNFCYREWYWEKFPENRDIQISPVAETTSTI